MPVFFNSQQLPLPQPEYVVWVDVMGIGPVMGRSLDMAANFIFKLHVAALQTPAAQVKLYPVMDGLYAATPNQQLLLAFLRSLLEECGQLFINTPVGQPLHRFIVRGALAYGPIIHGASVPNTAVQAPGVAQNVFATNPSYKAAIMLGLPMVQAHECERQAPPFGIYVHESARSFAPPGQTPLHHVWWKWGGPGNPTWAALPAALTTHYAWCRQNARAIQYEADRIAVHEEMASQYLA